MSSLESPTLPGRAAFADVGEPAEALAALRRQMAALEEQLAAVNQQQAELRTTLNRLLERFPEAGRVLDNASAEPLHRRFAGDVVRVLREVGRPLGTLEILEEMAARHLSSRESTVRHVLADLKNEGMCAKARANVRAVTSWRGPSAAARRSPPETYVPASAAATAALPPAP